MLRVRIEEHKHYATFQILEQSGEYYPDVVVPNRVRVLSRYCPEIITSLEGCVERIYLRGKESTYDNNKRVFDKRDINTVIDSLVKYCKRIGEEFDYEIVPDDKKIWRIQ